MKKNRKAQREYTQYLRWYAVHDYYASIALVIATFTIVPIAVLLIPLMTFVFISIGSERISKSAREKLKSVASIPRNVILLQAATHQVSIFSLPFVSILKVPEYIVREKDPKELAVMLNHELSHHVRHDTTKVLWVAVSTFFLLYYFVNSILLNLVFFPDPDSYGYYVGRHIANLVLVFLVILLTSLAYVSTLPESQRTRSARYKAFFFYFILCNRRYVLQLGDIGKWSKS